MRAIILAGGEGTRLRPYTYSLPKPLMPIGDEMPILEIILKQLKKKGFNHITLAVNYMAKIFQAFFGDGDEWNLKIDYSFEKKPLGTVGPLTLIEDLPNNFLIMNGDLLTDLDYKIFYNWHVKNEHDISVATFNRATQNDSGVLKFDDNKKIISFIEKPTIYNYISMGIYILNRKVIENLPKNEYYGFDDLITNGIKENLLIKAYVHDSYWLDIGSKYDYENANEYYLKNKEKILKF